MCHHAVNWVLNTLSKRDDMKPADLWLWIVMADHADRKYWSFVHSHGTLAEDAHVSRRTVVSSLARFEELGLIRRSARFRSDGTRSSDLVSILCSENPALGEIQSAKDEYHHVQIATPDAARFAQHKEGIKPGKVTKEAKASVDKIDDARSAFDCFNSMAKEIGASEARKLTSDRRRRLNARLKDCGGLEEWRRTINAIPESQFLRGDTHHHFSLTLDFVLQPSSFTKLVEGHYHTNRSQTDGKPNTGVDRQQQRANERLQPMFEGAQQALNQPRRWTLGD